MGHWEGRGVQERMVAVLSYRGCHRETRKLCNSVEVWGVGLGRGLGEDLRDEFQESGF